MNKKQWCALTAVTAMFLLTGLAVLKLQQTPAGGTVDSGGSVAIFTSSIVMYLTYLL